MIPPEGKPQGRKVLVERVRRRLRRDGVARLQMSIIVMGTGFAGFLISAALLALGVDSMGLRYGLAVAGAYASFLALVRGWVELYRRRIDSADVGDAVDMASELPVDLDAFDSLGGGGASGGAGATADWDDAPSAGEAVSLSGSADADPGGGRGLLEVLDLDEGWLIVLPIVLISALLASVLVIWSAPVLLAELVLDVVLVSTLYRRLAHTERTSWLSTAIRKTWVPVLIVGIVVIGGGLLLDFIAPEARTIGEALAGE